MDVEGIFGSDLGWAKLMCCDLADCKKLDACFYVASIKACSCISFVLISEKSPQAFVYFASGNKNRYSQAH